MPHIHIHMVADDLNVNISFSFPNKTFCLVCSVSFELACNILYISYYVNRLLGNSYRLSLSMRSSTSTAKAANRNTKAARCSQHDSTFPTVDS